MTVDQMLLQEPNAPTAKRPTPAWPAATCQLDLWLADREKHRDAWLRDERGVPREAPHQFVVHDRLLRALMLTGQEQEFGGQRLVPWPIGKSHAGAFLTWFVRRALRFERLPFCEDDLLAKIGDRDIVRAVLRELTPDRVDAITREVAALYTHTQAQLKAKTLTHVQLRRGISDFDRHHIFTNARISRGQAGQVAMLQRAARALGHRTIQLEMDTLNSWSDDGGYLHHPVQIHRRIPIEDVLCCTELLAERSESESGEWIIINRSLTGIVDIDVDDVDVRNGAVDEDQSADLANRLGLEDFWLSHNPLVLRGGLSPDSHFQGRPVLPLRLGYRLRRAWNVFKGCEL
jgi:hypothetical protein